MSIFSAIAFGYTPKIFRFHDFFFQFSFTSRRLPKLANLCRSWVGSARNWYASCSPQMLHRAPLSLDRRKEERGKQVNQQKCHSKLPVWEDQSGTQRCGVSRQRPVSAISGVFSHNPCAHFHVCFGSPLLEANHGTFQYWQCVCACGRRSCAASLQRQESRKVPTVVFSTLVLGGSL